VVQKVAVWWTGMSTRSSRLGNLMLHGKGACMTREEFLDAWASIAGRSPNPEQLVIMDHVLGPLQIIAGPGTGKTFALILRVLFLLCVCHVAPSAIVLTTFTHKAAEELRQRLHGAFSRLSIIFPELRTIDLSQMRLGTLHSLCWDILTETPGSPFRHLHQINQLEQAFFIDTTSSFIRKRNKKELDELDRQLESWIGMKPYRSVWQWVKLFTSVYERLYDDQIDRACFANAQPVYKRFMQYVEEYETALRERRFTDQTLVQQQALDLLRDPMGNPWGQNIQHIIVDEYQDTNLLQQALYHALAAAPPHNLCVVGDDDQALYRFRGGTVGCLVHFAEECERAWPECSVRQISLVENYRSEPTLVEWYNEYITIHPHMLLPNARVAGKVPLHAQPSSYKEAPIVVAIRGKTLKESACNFVTILRELVKQGVIESYAHCAMLAHSLKGEVAQAYISELQQQGIPIAGFSSYKEQQVYQQVLGTLFLALDRSKNLLPSTFAKENTTYVDECRQAAQAEPILQEMARAITKWLLGEGKAIATVSLTKLAQRILNAAPCIAAIEQDPDAEAAVQMLIQTLDAYDRIVEKGYRIPLEEVPGGAGKKRVAAWWMQRLYYTLVEGIQQEHLSRGEEHSPKLSPDALSLLTIHGAKGLEFPVVAVVVGKQNEASPRAEHQLERDMFPFRQNMTSKQAAQPDFLLGGNDEERATQDLIRLHYVAYSRAETLLLLLIVDDHLKISPPPLSLGADTEWFRKRTLVLPEKKRTEKKRNGDQQYGLWTEPGS
jgi:DNA helicase II / ATP-dependent DNA helicase PcrA